MHLIILENMREYTLEINHMNVIYMAKPLLIVLPLGGMRELILERNQISVIFVEKASLIVLALDDMKKFILEMSLKNVINMGKPLVHVLTLKNMRELHGREAISLSCRWESFTQFSALRHHERTDTGKKSYEYHQCGNAFTCAGMQELRLHRNCLNVTDVRKPSFEVILDRMRELTLDKNQNIIKMEKTSFIVLHLGDTGESTMKSNLLNVIYAGKPSVHVFTLT